MAMTKKAGTALQFGVKPVSGCVAQSGSTSAGGELKTYRDENGNYLALYLDDEHTEVSFEGILKQGQAANKKIGDRFEALGVTEEVTTLPVLRPLIGMDKEEIIRLSRRIGTFDTSILPYEDCCTVFTPRHPRTRPQLDEVRAAESVLDIEGLVDRAMKGREFVRLKY